VKRIGLPRAFACAWSVFAMGCASRGVVPAPTAGHQPDPVPPTAVVTPVAMPAATVAPPSPRIIVTHLADSSISAPMWRNARWGVLIVDATTGDTLYTHDADKLFMPASNQKLLTAAVAMQVLGPDYVWRTPVLLQGVQRGATFRGNVIVVGAGDPSVSDTMHQGDARTAFNPVADALAARGIRRVQGAIVTSGDLFPGQTSGFGWEVDDLDTPSGAAVDELLFNEGELRLSVRGAAKAGRAPTVVRAPTTSYPPLVIDATTRLASDTGRRLDIEYDSVAAVLRLTGTIAEGDSARLTTSYRHPNDAYRAAMIEQLGVRGIKVTGTAATWRRPPTADTLVTLVSPPLRDVLPRLQKPSQNQIAEIFFRTSGLRASGSGQVDSARAVAARTLAALGIPPEHVAYRDGSGMSRHDYVTPRALVRVLEAMRTSPNGALFRAALPLAGVDGTIANRMKGTPAAGNANAKTGTLDKTRSLSGYVTTVDGHVVIFSMLCNNFTVSTREVERVQDLLVSTLAGVQLGGSAGR
jgi:serine-type D-Ala-D-Ala carboxypeptidase/endopeptidase (penicillin-binding protein 4)